MSNLNSYKDTFKEALGLDTKIELEKLEYNQIPEWDSIGHMTLVSSLDVCSCWTRQNATRTRRQPTGNRPKRWTSSLTTQRTNQPVRNQKRHGGGEALAPLDMAS